MKANDVAIASVDDAAIEAATKLHSDNDALAKWYAAKYAQQEEWEDLLQAARLGLWRACLIFDPKRNTKFSVFAVVHMRASIQEYMRRAGRVRGGQGGSYQPRNISINELVERPGGRWEGTPVSD